MLTAQQAVAKEAAHREFDYPTRFEAERHGDLQGRDKLPRFRPGVEGIGITGRMLRIYVREDLAANLEIPSRFEGLLTQRVLTAGFRGFVAPRQARLSPAQCGVSVGHPAGETGTLGCLVDTPDGRCVLSNNRILAIANAAQIGDGTLQPGIADATCSNEPARIATLTDFEPLRFGSAVNRMDAAIAALDDANSAVPNIMTIGPPANPPVATFVGQSDTVSPQPLRRDGRRDMTDIRQAKRSLGRELRAVDGFLGVGIGKDSIRLYTIAETASVVKVFRDRWGNSYKGFAVLVVPTDGFEARAPAS